MRRPAGVSTVPNSTVIQYRRARNTRSPGPEAELAVSVVNLANRGLVSSGQ